MQPTDSAALQKLIGLFVVVLVSAGIWSTSDRLKSSRPTVEPDVQPAEVDAKGVRARLWQDPLLATKKCDRGRASCLPEGLHPEALVEGIRVLVVPQDGGPYADDHENRLRSRYAVLSALKFAGFVPMEAEHLGVWEVALPNLPSLKIPFEWFESAPVIRGHERPARAQGNDYGNVLVLWLDEDKVPGHVLRGSLALRDAVAEAIEQQLGSGTEQSIAVLGPTSSGVLLEMLLEMLHEQELLERKVVEDDCFKGIFSSWATIWQRGTDFRKLPLHRVTGTDLRLAEMLVQELHQRGQCPVHDGKPMALLAEWDTQYGRAWGETFEQAIETHAEGKRFCRPVTYAYMRGLDGLLPGERPEKVGGSANDTDTSSKGRRPGETPNQPQGRARYDYARRLAGQLAEADELPGSIGVLGSDVYDKLLLLRALRRDFRQAVFFTTDLDARLLHPSEYKWTRNLVIASHFSLSPLRDANLPPFRGSYQAGLFLACLDALGVKRGTEQPRLYEVGIGDAYPLDTEVQYPPRVLRAVSILLILVCSVLLLMAFVPAIRRRILSDPEQPEKRERFRLRVLAWTLLFALLGWILFWSAVPGEEPFALFAGVSAWPTGVLRFIACLIATASLFMVCDELRDSRVRIETDLLGETPEPSPDPIQWRDAFTYWQARWEIPTEQDSMLTIWRDYCARGTWVRRVLRLLPVTLVYVALCFLLLKQWGMPNNPVRGPVSSVTNKVVLIASVTALVILLFAVLDVTWLCTQFVRNLKDVKLRWPAKAFSETRHRSFAYGPETRELLRLRLVSQRAGVALRLLYRPFLVLMIMILSRYPIFDDWDLPLGLIFIFTLQLSAVLLSALALRHAAEEVRKASRQRLKLRIARLEHEPLADPTRRAIREARIASLERAIEEINDMHDGVYATWAQNPVLQALLIPFGGVGALALLEALV